MKTESSSKDTDVDRLIKGFLEPRTGSVLRKEEKLISKRHIVWPKELFIELVLSVEQRQKVRRWVKEKHSIIPFWSVNCERILFVDQDRFEEWTREKGKQT